MIREHAGLPIALGSHVHTSRGVAEVRAWDPSRRTVMCRVCSSGRVVELDLASVRTASEPGRRAADAHDEQRRRVAALAREVAEVTEMRRPTPGAMADMIAAMRRYLREVRK